MLIPKRGKTAQPQESPVASSKKKSTPQKSQSSDSPDSKFLKPAVLFSQTSEAREDLGADGGSLSQEFQTESQNQMSASRLDLSHAVGPADLANSDAGSSSGEDNADTPPSVPNHGLKRRAATLGGSEIGNKQFQSDFEVENPGWRNVGTPDELVYKLELVGYQCYHYLAVQLCLLLNTDFSKIRALLLEGPSGCGKSFMAKSISKVCGAELMCLSCYKGMPTQNLIESPSTLAMVNAMAGKSSEMKAEEMMNLGILSRAFLKSQTQPVLLLIDELDKPDGSIDTFFLGPIQDARIWLESRAPIDANVDNILLVFTKNWNRTIDEALLRRVHPVRMTYLDSTLERKILAPHCHAQLVDNLVSIADRMRNTGGSYAFERPPAPEELLTAGNYVTRLMDWGMQDFGFVGKNIWAILAKSEHDRSVLEHMMRYHPDFMDPLFPDGKNAPLDEIHARLGRIILNQIVVDPRVAEREAAWKSMEFN